LTAFIHGFVLALGLILPLGVQNIFIFTQGVTQKKFRHALPAVITAALCDTCLIIVAILGLSLIVLQFEWLRLVLMIGGAIFLLYMSVAIWRAPAATIGGAALAPRKQIIFALSVSLLNPSALLDIVAVIGTSSMKYDGIAQFEFALSCITVSWLWFFGLALTAAILKKANLPTSAFQLMNKCSAIFIVGTACYILYSLV
jgi:L-lysine exporter family protein LysE/ArgO